MRRIKLRTQFGSHLPVLIKLVSTTSGPILELGSGMYSTPYLHWECHRTGRELVTYEGVEQYYDLALGYNNGNHRVVYIDDWDNADFSRNWSIAFVDHSPGERRGRDIVRLGHADYVIVHDAIRKYEKPYGYVDAFKAFKYSFKYKDANPWTMVLSNKKDLRGFSV